MKKRILFYVTFLMGFITVSQTLSNREAAKLNKLNIQVERLDLSNADIQKDLNLILKLDKKRRINKIVAIVLNSFAVLSATLGVAIISSSDNKLEEGFGTVFLVGGLSGGGMSIPFWIASSKRKKERDKLTQNLLF